MTAAAAAAAVVKGYSVYTRGEPVSGRRDALQVENRRRAVGTRVVRAVKG